MAALVKSVRISNRTICVKYLILVVLKNLVPFSVWLLVAGFHDIYWINFILKLNPWNLFVKLTQLLDRYIIDGSHGLIG